MIFISPSPRNIGLKLPDRQNFPRAVDNGMVTKKPYTCSATTFDVVNV